MTEREKMDVALERMEYRPECGGLFRIYDCDNWRSGDKVYERDDKGYRYVRCSIMGSSFDIKIHRIGFYFMTGYLPDQVDHKNRIKHDNRWRNLRDSNSRQNSINKSTWNALLVKGVDKTKSGKFRARIRIDGQNLTIGLFDRLSDAADAYDSAAYSVHGEYAWLNCDQV
jgi:hypothetical protein